MPLEEFIIWVYCWIDENVSKVLENTKLRSRGFQLELISGVMDYLWRAIHQDGDEIDILVQKRKDKKTTMRFFKRLLKGEGTTLLKVLSTSHKVNLRSWI